MAHEQSMRYYRRDYHLVARLWQIQLEAVTVGIYLECPNGQQYKIEAFVVWIMHKLSLGNAEMRIETHLAIREQNVLENTKCLKNYSPYTVRELPSMTAQILGVVSQDLALLVSH